MEKELFKKYYEFSGQEYINIQAVNGPWAIDCTCFCLQMNNTN